PGPGPLAHTHPFPPRRSSDLELTSEVTSEVTSDSPRRCQSARRRAVSTTSGSWTVSAVALPFSITNLMRTFGAPAGENSRGARCARARLVAFARRNPSCPFVASIVIRASDPDPYAYVAARAAASASVRGGDPSRGAAAPGFLR